MCTAMVVSGHLLILLVPVLSICGATEYYVRPTEPTNTSCPAQPCLTLSQYTSDSDHYFKSNTVFKFLPGTHHMDRPLTIGNVHNISFEGLSNENDEYPHLVAQFSSETEGRECVYMNGYYPEFQVCCAAIWLHDMYNVTVKGISIAVQISNKHISVVILKNVLGITVQLRVACSLTDHDNRSVGIIMYEATSVEVHSSSASNCSFGLMLHNTTNTHITKVTAMYNKAEGINLNTCTDTNINNSIAAHNGETGMKLKDMNNTNITNITTAYNGEIGMNLFTMRNTNITNMTTTYNGNIGMALFNMSNTHILNMTTAHNGKKGIDLYGMINTNITNMTTTYHGENGMSLMDMINTHITNTTTAYNGGNGMILLEMNNTHITNTIAIHNSYQGMYLLNANNTHMTKITATHNVRIHVYIEAYNGQIVIENSMNIVIYNTSFTDQSTFITATPTSLPAVIELFKSVLFVSGCDFTRNNISALAAYASNITVSGDLTFTNNTAFAGTAFILILDSILTSAENSHTYFLNNHATNIGGVFYITSNNIHEYWFAFFGSIVLKSTCFLTTEGSRSQTRFTFANNSAGKGGDILYGGHVANGSDGEWNCLESFKNISNISQSGLSPIASDPLRVCLCSGTVQPDCLVLIDPTPRTVYPGQTINISAVVVGQNFGTVSGSAYAQFLQGGCLPQLKSEPKVQSVTQHNCSNLSYTIFLQSGSQSEVSEGVLVLTAHDSYVPGFPNMDVEDYTIMLKEDYHNPKIEPLLYSDSPVYINVSILPCPPGFTLTTASPFKCDCNGLLQKMPAIHCHIQEQTIGRSGLLWVGMIQDDNRTNGTVAASEYCSLDYCNAEDSNVTLSEPDSQCNYNHSGTLCGGCQPGLSLALGSAQCLQCSNKYLALLIPLTLAGPVLVFSIKLLDLTISQGTLNGLIFYANVVKANEYIFFPSGQTNPLTVFIAWLNLDLGVETCLFQGLTAYSKTWLQFVFPFYIWSIAGLVIILAKYSNRMAKVMGNNSVPVLATLVLLSYAN